MQATAEKWFANTLACRYEWAAKLAEANLVQDFLSDKVALVKRLSLFHEFAEEECQEIASVSSIRTFKPGEAVTVQGADATELYVVLYGTAVVQADGASEDDSTIVRTLVKGSYFGESALFTPEQPRTVSVIAGKSGQLILLAIDCKCEEQVQKVLKSAVTTMQFATANVLKVNPAFAKLSQVDRSALEQGLVLQYYDPGELIIRQGDAAFDLFLILKGSVIVRIRDRSGFGSEQHVGTLKAGEYFGERALMTNELRSSNIYAYEKCAIFSISKESLGELGLREKVRQQINLRAPIQWAQRNSKVDGNGDGGLGELDREPFSRLVALLRPFQAVDAKRTLPFATLDVTIQKAGRLSAFGSNYCALDLNNQHTYLSTSLQSGAQPEWGETFTLGIYHPLSTLTVRIYDSFSGLTGLVEDNLLGYVDIDLNDFVCNEWREAVLKLKQGSGFINDLSARESREHEERTQGEDAGDLHVALRLQCEISNRFFAMWLPKPNLGTGLQPLDLSRLLEEIMCLSKQIDFYVQRLTTFFLDLFLWRSIWRTVWVLVLVSYMIWHPWSLLPGLLLLTCYILLCGHPKMTDRNTGVSASQILELILEAFFTCLRRPVLAVQQLRGLLFADIDTKSMRAMPEAAQEDTYDVLGYGQKARGPLLAHEEEMEQRLEGNVEDALKQLQPWMPSNAVQDLQLVQKNVREVLFIVQLMSTVMRWKQPEASSLIVTASICLAVPLIITSWMARVVQFSACIGFLFFMFEFSPLGRLFFAILKAKKGGKKAVIDKDTQEWKPVQTPESSVAAEVPEDAATFKDAPEETVHRKRTSIFADWQ
eukprot:TRINITY_DN110030_c0_g1_i1.p1 TRINITY_DN110030_c0_g1~~TRINITY_DN110030_c0_g1_i1.p1  ORF type:complete len:823 (+),score=166.14 TRINITY_DN110030_c0_g1_i1:170-2638(+)